MEDKGLERLNSAMTTLIVLGCVFVALGIVFMCVDKINQARCYNMALNDFYKDYTCTKYTEVMK